MDLEAATRMVQRAWRSHKARERVRAIVFQTFEKVYDESSGYYYYLNKKTGESSWEDPSSSHPGSAEELGGHRARYVQHETGEGTPYFVPESGEGETVWILPKGAELVD